MDYRHQEIRKAFFGTGTWIFHHQSYLKWVEESRGLLWIKGKPGSGKSTIMKRILDAFTDERALGQVQLYFFFHRRGEHLQYTQIGMFRAVLYQLLIQVTSTRVNFQKVWEEKKRRQGGENYARHWQLEELRTLFSSLLLAAAEKENVRIFLDALDEAGEESAKDLLSYLYGLGEDVRKSNVCVSICFSCRKYPVFANHGGLEIWLDHENYNDIVAFTAAELNLQLLKDSNHAVAVKVLQADFAHKALGVFLWVALMVPIVAKQYNDGNVLESVRQELRRVPSDLSQIYKHIMKDVVDPEKRPKTLRLMQLVFLAERPLSHLELHNALMFDDDTAQSAVYACETGESGLLRWKDIPDNDVRLERSILSISGGLAETKFNGKRSRQARVQFIHESVNDFWREDYFRCLSSLSSNDPTAEIHYQICLFCLDYCKIVWKTVPHNRDENSNEEIAWRFPFINYATTAWVLHAKKAESRGIQLTELLQIFEWPSQEICTRWLLLYECFIDSESDPGFQRGATLLHAAAAFNLVSFMRALLENGAEVDEEDREGNTALTFAVSHRHGEGGTNETAVQLLVDYGADLNTPRSGRDTPLTIAAKLGDEASVRILVNNGADVNAYYHTLPDDHKTRGPLLAAAESNNDNSVAIARILLDNGADVEGLSRSIQGHNPLWAAVLTKDHGVAQLLLERGARINPQYRLLNYAVTNQHEELFPLLLDYGAEVNDEARGFPKTALVEALDWRSHTLVGLLLEAGADIEGNESKYGSLYKIAKESRYDSNAKILLLLKHKYGRKWALKSGFTLERTAKKGSEAILRLLLRVSVKRPADEYDMLLQSAKTSKIDREWKVKLLLAYKYGLRWLNSDWVSAAGSPTKPGNSSEDKTDQQI